MHIGKTLNGCTQLALNALEQAGGRALALLGISVFGRDNIHKTLPNFFTEIRNIRFRNQGLLSDGLPIPPRQLIFLVTGTHDEKGFYDFGALGANCIRGVCKRNGLDINSFGSILDFGCGCGRILRHWKTLKGPKIYGSDYNASLVDWCRKSLPFAEVGQNELSAKLDYENDKFDFIYAISVFTHLSKSIQDFWINELTRVLKPGKHLLITVQGTTRLHQLPPEEQRKFKSGQLVVLKPELAGTNLCGTYHPEMYVREWLRNKLVVVDFVAGGAKDADQDVFLLQKPTTGICTPM